MRCGTSCSRPLLGAVLVLLFAYLQAGLVMAAAAGEAEVLADGVASGVGAVTKVLGRRGKAFGKGFKVGHEIAKADDDRNHKQFPDWTEGGASPPYVEFISVAGTSSPIPVLTADITSTAAVRIDGFGCTPTPPLPMRATIISLLGRGGTVPLGAVYSVSSLACRKQPDVGTVRLWAVLGLGRGSELSARFPTFSYIVLPRGKGLYTQVWLGPAPLQQRGGGQRPPQTTLLSFDSTNMGRYYVQITGIHVGGLNLSLSRPGVIGERAYLSTNDDDTFTYLEGLQYNRLKLVLLKNYFLNVPVTQPASQRREQLCVGAVAERSLPPIAMVFVDNAIMDVDPKNLWYREGSNFCLAILPSQDNVSVLGSFLQREKMMTISTQSGITTLTF